MTVVNRKHNLALAALVALAFALPIAAQAQGGVEPNAQTQATNGEDYAANELGNPWDMDSQNDIAFEYTRDNGQISNLRFEDGKLKATSASNDPRITILVPSDQNVNPVLPEGGYRPIDTSYYKYLTVRLNVGKQTNVQILWQQQGGAFNTSEFQRNVPSGWQTLTFDLSKTGGFGQSGAWSGQVQGLYLDPTTEANVPFEVDYARLSPTAPAAPDNTPPVFNITSPSYISGPDYATSELSNPWDMNDASDVERFFNVSDISFNNGLLRGVNTTNDPAVALNVPNTINTSKYKYVTYRMSVDGKIDTVNGSVARLIWYVRPELGTTSRDIVVYEGFRTVSFDLTKIRTEPNAGSNIPWLQSAPSTFRLDTHEFPDAHHFNVDYVMLTGDSTASASYDIRYVASDADGGAPTIKLAYDTDRNPSNGTTPISCVATSSVAAATSKSFIPLVSNGLAPPVTPSGSLCRWNTAGIANGTYYIYGTADDGTDSVGRYSQTPVVVQH